MAITNLVVKVASRCNLNCTYCYMYNLGDSTYKNQPKKMSSEVVDHLMYRVKEHCLKHHLKSFSFVLHGGEPLLAGKDFFKYFQKKSKEVLKNIVVNLGVQTNGVLLDEEWCELLGKLGYGIGVSLDGPKEINDKFRLDHAGRGSYDDIVKGLKIAQTSGHIDPPGVLSVINVNTDPLEIYNHFKILGIKSCDFLLPDSNYNHPPPQAVYTNSDTPYADWLIKLFDHWFYEDSSEVLDISTFNLYIDNILGSESKGDNMGKGENQILIIETNGDIESVDVLKICGDGFTKNDANVLTHSFDEAMQTPLAKLYRNSGQMLCKKCLACPVNETCGAGYIPHRYNVENGFNNPSIYCNNLMKLITHIQNTVYENLPQEFIKESDVRKMTYEECQQTIAKNIQIIEEPIYLDELMIK